VSSTRLTLARGGTMFLKDTIMRATTIVLTLISLVLAGLLSPSLAQPGQPTPAQLTPTQQPAPTQPAATQPSLKRGGPCAQIAQACQQAGFVRNGAKRGVGIVLDCIRPIMIGVPQEVPGTKTLPQIDPQVVAACKQRNPNFGQGGRAKLQPSA
jgi:hypothetical protein